MAPRASTYGPRDRRLEWALLANFLIHAVAILAMVALLLPTLPGGSAHADADRIVAIARHPWLFRLGWLPWQACAAGDLWLAIAMVRAPWLPRAGAWAVLVLTAVAVVPDQLAQALWVTRGVELAQTDPGAYLAFEASIFPLTAGWGALFYTFAALGWTYCFARGGTWTRVLTWLSVPLWSTMLVAVVSPLLPPSVRPPPAFVSAANGLGFFQLQIWLGLVAEAVLLRARPFPSRPYGRLARWRYPSSSPLARLVDAFANSRFFGALLEPIPEAAMQSDITDVVYVNYLVPADALAPLVPEGLLLQRLGPDGAHALFTFLTFRHGHFGFAFLGRLRRFLPSPIQTNWRIHVKDPHTGHLGILFLTNATTAFIPAIAARMLTEGMPMHVLGGGEIARTASGDLRVTLDPGEGSAPDADLALRACDTPTLTGPWAACWPDFHAFLAYCVPQDRAMSSQPLRRRVSRQEIDLGIPLSACAPMAGTVVSRAAEAIVGGAAPLCFHVPGVSFRFSVEAHDRVPSSRG